MQIIQSNTTSDPLNLLNFCLAKIKEESPNCINIVDCASGHGKYAIASRNLCFNVTAFDIRPDRIPFNEKNISWEISHINDFDFSNFDIIIISGILYHMTIEMIFSLFERIKKSKCKYLIINTHFIEISDNKIINSKHNLSLPISFNGIEYAIYNEDITHPLSSFDNKTSHWLTINSIEKILCLFGFNNNSIIKPFIQSDRCFFLCSRSSEAFNPFLCLSTRNEGYNPFPPVIKTLQENFSLKSYYNNTLVIVGYNLICDIQRYRKDYPGYKIVIYQLEQLYDNKSLWFNRFSKLDIVKKRTSHIEKCLSECDEIWDYDQNNINFLIKEGYFNIKHIPLLFCKNLFYKNNIKKPKYDIIFFGRVNQRRFKFLLPVCKKFNVLILSDSGSINEFKNILNATFLESQWGQNLFNHIFNSKLVLNIHHYDSCIQEQVRIFELLINNCTVLSEKSITNYFENSIKEFSTIDEMMSLIENSLQNTIPKKNYPSLIFKNISKKFFLKSSRNIIIITRTYNRPVYFENCFNSIFHQQFNGKIYHVIIDNNNSKNYTRTFSYKNYQSFVIHTPKIDKENKSLKYENTNLYHAPWNTLFNIAFEHILLKIKNKELDQNSIIMYLDDDDQLARLDALQLISDSISFDNNFMALWRVKFPDRIVPNSNNFKAGIAICDFSTIGFAHSPDLIKYTCWDEYALGDYRSGFKMYQYSNHIYINHILTSLQRETANGLGKGDDLNNQKKSLPKTISSNNLFKNIIYKKPINKII